MKQITMIGVDLAKNVFQLHGVDASHQPVLRRQLRRTQMLPFFAKIPPCLVVMEACGSAHYWAREIGALGHEVRLVPPAYARPFAKRGKSDSIDAEAVCEAGARPSMRFVPVKSPEAQALGALHRTRALLDKQRTMLINALRAHLAEFGFVAGKGVSNVPNLARIVEEAPPSRNARAKARGQLHETFERDQLYLVQLKPIERGLISRLPDIARGALRGLLHMIEQVNLQLGAIEKELRAFHRNNDTSQRLAATPGIGLITATALTGLTPDATSFKNGRHFAAWMGITPRQDSTGGKTRLLGISKAGNGYLRRLLVLGATSMLRSLEGKTTRLALWAQGLLARRPKKVVIVALANKLARIAWAIMAKGEPYRAGTIEAQAGAAA
jgi:transposase